MKTLKKIIPYILVTILMMVLANGAGAASRIEPAREGWTQMAPLPEPVAHYGRAQCATDPGRFYIIGGTLQGSPHPEYTAAVQVYTVQDNRWASLAPLPQALAHVAATCHEGRIYVAGGRGSTGVTDTLYVYDIADNRWSHAAALPRPTWRAALAGWDGFLYLVGGFDATELPPFPSRQVDRYVIGKGVWEAAWGKPLPVSTVASVAQAGPYLYLVGGHTLSSQHANATLRYDMIGDAWAVGPKFNSRRADFALAVDSQYLYAMGGVMTGEEDPGGAANPTNLVERLDHTNWLSESSLSTPWEEVDNHLPEPLFGNAAGFCTPAPAADGKESLIWSVGGLAEPAESAAGENQFMRGAGCFRATYQAALSESALSASGAAGESVDYVFTLENRGNVADVYRIATLSEWPVTVWEAEPAVAEDIPDTVGPVDPHGRVMLLATVTIPVDARPGDEAVSRISFRSKGDPDLVLTLELQTAVDPVPTKPAAVE